MNHLPIRTNTKPPKLISMLNRKKDLWTDSDTDLSTASDSDSITVSRISTNTKTSIGNTDTSSERNCCLICSILSSLSSINCCRKHLALLTTAQVVYMMPSEVGKWPKLKCHCRPHGSKFKERHRSCSSSSSSLLSSISPHRRNKQSVPIQSFNNINTDDILLSSNIEEATSNYDEPRRTSIKPQKRRLKRVQTSLTPPSTMKTNNKKPRKSNQIPPSSVVTRSKQRNNNQTESVVQNETVQPHPQQINNSSASPDLIELDSDLSYCPRILLHRIVHVKDDGEEAPPSNRHTTLNMSQATEQMVDQRNSQPKILLKRMSNLEEKLIVLKKKKLTAKIVVEQQRNEICLLKSSLTLNQRLEEIYKRFDKKINLDNDLYYKIIQVSNDKHDQIHRIIENLSKLIEQILIILSLNHNTQLKNPELDLILTKQKECFKLIKLKLSDIYANRLADEVSYRMDLNIKDKLCFEDFNLPSGLLLGLYAMGFQNGPSDTQALILPYSLPNQLHRNIIVQAKTGTGKTISYIIHVLARLQSIHSHPQALIIVPTVELAFTVGSGIEKISVYLPDIQITYATSSLLLTQKSFNTAIVIGTIDAFDSFQSLIDFSQLEMLIIDEIDTMVIREDYRHILLNLMDHLPLINHCQLLVYSSTLSEQIMNFTNELIPNSILIKQRSDKQQLSNIEQFYVMCQDENKKIDVIMIILQQFIDSQIMIFCADDETTERIYNNILIENKNNARILTTNSNNQERISLIEEFRSNLFRIFVLSAQTSATTHGVDLDNVNIVINYNLPCSLGINSDLDYVTYHQRLDRCGRYDKHGYLFNLIQSLEDWNIQLGQQNYFSFLVKQIDMDGIRALKL